MLVLGARDGDVGGLHLGILKLGLCLGKVGLYGDAAEVAVVGDADSFCVLRDGVVEELLLGIGGAQLKVIHRDFSLERQQGGLEIRCRCLRLLAGRSYVAADCSPEIDFIVQLQRQLEVTFAVVGSGGEVGLVGGVAFPPKKGLMPTVGYLLAFCMRRLPRAALRLASATFSV